MKKHMRIIFAAVLSFALVGAFALVGCSQPAEQPKQDEPTPAPEAQHEAVGLQIFAANSLSKAMEEVQELYKKDHSWVTFVDTQYKSSGELNEMLVAGSQADILISASKGKMDDAEKAEFVDPTTRFDMFKNDLVIVAKEGSGLSGITLQDIADGTYTLAVGDDSVPAGNYAAQALSTVGAYDDGSGKTGKDIAGTKGAYVGITPVLDTSVGNVCKHAESGDVDLAIVYSSDVQRFGGVEVVGEISADTHKAIIYPAAILADSQVSDDADEFLKWATSNEDALKLWQKWGFELA